MTSDDIRFDRRGPHYIRLTGGPMEGSTSNTKFGKFRMLGVLERLDHQTIWRFVSDVDKDTPWCMGFREIITEEQARRFAGDEVVDKAKAFIFGEML